MRRVKRRKSPFNVHQDSRAKLSGSYARDLTSEARAVLDSVLSIENDLKMRIKMYGTTSVTTLETLRHFVKSCSDHAGHALKKGQHRLAIEILGICEFALNSGQAGEHPNFKFEIFNNLAHAHNVQGNVRLSLKYLKRAVENGLKIPGLSDPFSYVGTYMIETYLNIGNA